MSSTILTELRESAPKSVAGASMGLVPRLIAAGWFGLAALAPVAFFFLVFRRQLNMGLDDLWIFAEVPVASAALLGFLLGPPIMNTNKRSSGALRGLSIATMSYPLFMASWFLAAIPSDDRGYKPVLSELVAELLLAAAVGAMYVGWLIVIVGIVAGVILRQTSDSQSFQKRWLGPNQVDHGRAALWSAVAIVIYLINGLVPLVLKIR